MLALRSPAPPQGPPCSVSSPQVYEQYIVQDPPDCLSTLRRMLQAGPVTRLYTGGGGKYVGSHEGYSLRMPPAEVPDWQMVNDKGDLVDIPRPCRAVRVWNAAARAYDVVGAELEGAPADAAAADAWFVGVVRRLKGSNFLGPDLLDALVTSTKTVSMEALGNRDYAAAFEGTFSSRWSQLVVDTKL